MKKTRDQAMIVFVCVVIAGGLLSVDSLKSTVVHAQQKSELTDVDRLRAENAVLRANLNEAQRQIVDLTSKLLAADRAALSASIHETYHADLDWQTLGLKPVATDPSLGPTTTVPQKEPKR